METQIAYRLVVRGELSGRYARVFEGMSVVPRAGRTEILGDVRDQSQLLGLIERVHGLGLELVSVAPLDERVEAGAS